MFTNLPAKVSRPATVAILSCISTSTVPRQCLPGGSPNAAMASDTRTNPKRNIHKNFQRNVNFRA